jgi:nicotinate-nucleotide pyrophosphorylase (carboxylating)
VIPFSARRVIETALEEDLGLGDVTTSAVVPPAGECRVAVVAREPLVVCGGEIAAHVFWRLDPDLNVELALADGAAASAGQRVLYVAGRAQPILAAERTALNLMQHLSGIATATRAYVERLRGTAAAVCETRKTTPGLRELEKYAVRCGGGRNHRASLADCVMIKDNHIAVAGGVAAALRRAREQAPHVARIEVEADTLAQVREAADAGADVILLDNMPPAEVRTAVEAIGGRAITEASGSIRLDNVRAYAEAGVDMISTSALTSMVRRVDLGLELEAD